MKRLIKFSTAFLGRRYQWDLVKIFAEIFTTRIPLLTHVRELVHTLWIPCILILINEMSAKYCEFYGISLRVTRVASIFQIRKLNQFLQSILFQSNGWLQLKQTMLHLDFSFQVHRFQFLVHFAPPRTRYFVFLDILRTSFNLSDVRI